VAIALGYIAGDKAAKWARSRRMLQVPVALSSTCTNCCDYTDVHML
jgi:hypothetical protein